MDDLDIVRRIDDLADEEHSLERAHTGQTLSDSEVERLRTIDANEICGEAEFVDDAIDEDEVTADERLLLDRKELNELGSLSTIARASPMSRPS
jgi:hypothetical protein